MHKTGKILAVTTFAAASFFTFTTFADSHGEGEGGDMSMSGEMMESMDSDMDSMMGSNGKRKMGPMGGMRGMRGMGAGPGMGPGMLCHLVKDEKSAGKMLSMIGKMGKASDEQKALLEGISSKVMARKDEISAWCDSHDMDGDFAAMLDHYESGATLALSIFSEIKGDLVELEASLTDEQRAMMKKMHGKKAMRGGKGMGKKGAGSKKPRGKGHRHYHEHDDDDDEEGSESKMEYDN